MNFGTRILYAVAVCLLTTGAMAKAQAGQRPAGSAVTADVEKSAAGTWQGTLEARNGRSFRVVIKLAFTDGRWSGTLYNLDQGGAPVRASAVAVSGDAVKMDVATLGGGFAGVLSRDARVMEGTWTQGPVALPLKLERATAETAWALPGPAKKMAADADPSFEIATIKPNDSATQMGSVHVDQSNRFTVDAATVADLISVAYDVQLKQVAGDQSWTSEERYDIQAKPDTEGSPDIVQLRKMLRKLLAERFGLKVHEESREMSAFVLTVAKDGLKIAHSASEAPLPGLGFHSGKGGLTFTMHNATMDDFASTMQRRVLDRPLVNKTGLAGQYDMTFIFEPDATMFNGHAPATAPADANGEEAPGLAEAMERQAGLKLEAKKTLVKVVVIDSVAKPTGN